MSSISYLENSKSNVENIPESNIDLPEVVTDDTEEKQDSIVDAEEQINEGPRACEDERFIRFFKMIQFGVPLAAVKQKMVTEGLDPSVLE